MQFYIICFKELKARVSCIVMVAMVKVMQYFLEIIISTVIELHCWKCHM